VREAEGALRFEVVEDVASSTAVTASDAALDRLRDRVEALGGRLTIRSERGRGTRVSGWLPFL
jgi:signal transduction histidine kinase